MGIEYPAPQQARYGQISQDTYDALIAKLRTDPNARNLGANMASTPDLESGSVTYQSIDFAWVYDSAKQELTLSIVADHNWKAKIAGNQTIFEMINEKLLSPAASAVMLKPGE